MSYPRHVVSRNFKTASSVSKGSDMSITSAWAQIDALLTATVAAQVGDVLELMVRGCMVAGGGEIIFLDFAVAGTRIGHSTDGLYKHQIPASFELTHTLIDHHTVVSGDLSSGLVTVVPFAKTSGTTRAMRYLAPPAQFTVKNIGPADPN